MCVFTYLANEVNYASTVLHLFLQSKEEYANVWQSLQNSGPPQKPPAHWQNNVSVCFRFCLMEEKTDVSESTDVWDKYL